MIEATASLQLEHLHIRDITVPAEKRWPLVICFPGVTSEEVPIGSKIVVPKSLKAELDAGGCLRDLI